jgi:DNA topoisomerase-1
MKTKRKNGRRAADTTVVDPVASAKAAGLRYVRNDRPGIRRLRAGAGFRYVGPDGRPVRDPETLGRIRSLAIPPAWTDVWICPLAAGHLQATGIDSRGRKQYRYHSRWRAVRDETKYHRMADFGRALAEIRARTDADLRQAGLPRTKVLAGVVCLLEITHIRVGNEEYARANHSFGLTTLRDGHAKITGGTVRFRFRGKSGVRHAVDLHDRRLARLVRRCQEVPGDELFQYLDDEGNPHDIDSADVNAYLHEIAGQEFTAKDFRTWAGTLLAARALRAAPSSVKQTEARRHIVAAIEAVSRELGNTPAVCRKCYVHPGVINAYLDGSLFQVSGDDLAAEEEALLDFLCGGES